MGRAFIKSFSEVRVLYEAYRLTRSLYPLVNHLSAEAEQADIVLSLNKPTTDDVLTRLIPKKTAHI